jgi:hypothetical protein
MPGDRPLTQYGRDIPRPERVNDLREGITTPDEAERTDKLVALKKPDAKPYVRRRLGRVDHTW